jgi:hypothetical protein
MILPVSVGCQPGTFGNARLSIQTVAGTCRRKHRRYAKAVGAVSTDVRERPSPTASDRQSSENMTYITV